jgi:hypothetical protein
MAAPGNRAAPPPANGGGSPAQYERIVAVVVAVWVIGLVSFLILSTRPFDPARIYFLKILLSLSCGVMVATLPGFINLDLTLPGIGLRAAGGAAAFVFVFTQSPSVPQLGLAAPDIKVNQLHGVDFRSLIDPEMDANFLHNQIAITAIPVEVRNERQPSIIGSLKKTDLRFDLGGRDYAFHWYYFVQLLPGSGGSWLTSEEKLRRAEASDLSPGKQFSEEIMHLSDQSPQWIDFVEAFRALDNDLVVTLTVVLSSGEIVRQCKILPSRYKTKIAADEERLHRIPAHIATVCET